MAKPAKPDLMQHAAAAEAAGQFSQAATILKHAINANPKNAAALSHLVRLLARKLNKTSEALTVIPQLLKVAPKSALAHELAAECFCRKRMMVPAREHADKTVTLGPKSPDGLYVAATIYYELEQYDDATKCMETCLSVRPNHLPSRLLYAKSLRAAGELKKAEGICRDIFAEFPDSMANYQIWQQTCKIAADDPMYLRLRDVIYPVMLAKNAPGLGTIENILGKAANDIGDYEDAFEYFTSVKDRKTERHDRGVNKKYVSTLIAGVSRGDYFGAPGHDSESPVLVVGMPRSGSTLLEQILSSHPQIGGIGESRYLRAIATSAGFTTHNGQSMVDLIHRLSANDARTQAEQYLAQSTKADPGMLRIVDKNLHNFELLGYYAKLFPKARILNVLRDPMDNCVSCYLQPLSDFHSYTQDLTSLGQYYVEFRRLMTHWKTTLPNPIMEVHYEDVVADTEGKAREVIDFLGIDWDPACLSFQENQNRARTLSTWQVRQPIYKTSVQRWTRYDKFLDPLKVELAPFYPDGF